MAGLRYDRFLVLYTDPSMIEGLDRGVGGVW